MVKNQCAQCGRELRKNLTRCRYCEDLKYQAEIASPETKKIKKRQLKVTLITLIKESAKLSKTKK